MSSPFTATNARRAAALTTAALCASLGLGLIAASPAGATTTAVTSTTQSPFVTTEQTYTGGCATWQSDATPSPDQALRAGPATPPSGTGSLSMPTENVDDLELVRTAKYDGTAVSDLATLQYSTYLETAGGQPQYLRLHVDIDNDGVADHILMFIPANNTDTQGRAVTAGVWQTWNPLAATAVWSEDGDPSTTFTGTLAAYDTANNGNTTIVESFAPGAGENVNVGGGTSFIEGCGAGPAAQTADLDLVVVGITGQPVEKYDFEATAPARTMTVNPTSGTAGTSIHVTGTDCFEPSAKVELGEGNGQSGGPIAATTVTPAANGTFSATLTVPSSAEADSSTVSHVVVATCGPDAAPAFDYAYQKFTVTSSSQKPTGASGYRMVAADGGIFTFGDRVFHGSTGDLKLNKPIVGGATNTSTYDGYWIVASDGGVFTFNAPFYGSLGDKTLTSPATEIEPTPSGLGYYIVQADGTVTAFGDAKNVGDMRGKALNKPIIGMSVTPTGNGYWLVGEDGGIFNFGDAGFFGSTGGMKLNAPVIDLAPAVDNNGYYLLAKDGGVFTFGSAVFKGSTGDMKLNAPVIAMLVAPTGAGYWLAATDGGIFTFGAVDFLGSMGGTKLNSPVLDLIN